MMATNITMTSCVIGVISDIIFIPVALIKYDSIKEKGKYFQCSGFSRSGQIRKLEYIVRMELL